MTDPQTASLAQHPLFSRSRSIELGRTPPNWMRVKNSIAEALQGSHSVELLSESSERLTLKLQRRHVPQLGFWRPSPVVILTLTPDGTSLSLRLIWSEYSAALLFAALWTALVLSLEIPLFLLLWPLLLATTMFFDHRRAMERIDDAVRSCAD